MAARQDGQAPVKDRIGQDEERRNRNEEDNADSDVPRREDNPDGVNQNGRGMKPRTNRTVAAETLSIIKWGRDPESSQSAVPTALTAIKFAP